MHFHLELYGSPGTATDQGRVWYLRLLRSIIVASWHPREDIRHKIVRVGLVEFGERHDTHGQTGSTIHRIRTPADKSGQRVAIWTGKSPDTRDILAASSRRCRACRRGSSSSFIRSVNIKQSNTAMQYSGAGQQSPRKDTDSCPKKKHDMAATRKLQLTFWRRWRVCLVQLGWCRQLVCERCWSCRTARFQSPRHHAADDRPTRRRRKPALGHVTRAPAYDIRYDTKCLYTHRVQKRHNNL